MIRNRVAQIKAAEPTISKVHVDFITQPSLRPYAHDVTDQQHPDHQFRINRRTSDVAVKWSKVIADVTKIDEPVD